MNVDAESARRLDRVRHAVPPEYCCPIGGDLMHDPVTIFGMNRGHVYEAANIQTFFNYCRKENKAPFSPLTRQVLNSTTLIKALPAYNDIKEYAAKNPELNHRMARAPATNAAQVCATMADFAALLKHLHETNHQLTLKRTRGELVSAAALLTPLLFCLRAVPGVKKNIALQAILGVVWGCYMTMQLERAQRARIKSLAPQKQQAEEVRQFLATEPLAPEVRQICDAHLNSIELLMTPRSFGLEGGAWAAVASLQGVAAGLHVASWAGDRLQPDQAVFLCLFSVCLGFLLIAAVCSLQKTLSRRFGWTRPHGFDLAQSQFVPLVLPSAVKTFENRPYRVDLEFFDDFLQRGDFT